MHHNPRDPKLPHGGDLLYHTWAVIFFYYGGVLFHLGFSPEQINGVFASSRYQWWLFDKAKSMYAKNAKE